MILLKNEDQINGIRKSCHLLADLFNEIIPRVKPGISTKEIDDWCCDFVRRFGGVPAWYEEHFPGKLIVTYEGADLTTKAKEIIDNNK